MWKQLFIKSQATPKARYSHAAASVEASFHGAAISEDAALLIHGGYSNNPSPTWYHDLWVLFVDSLGEGQWKEVPIDITQPYPKARYSHTLTAAHGGRFILFGGDDGGSSTTSSQSYAWGSYFEDLWILTVSRLFQEGSDYSRPLPFSWSTSRLSVESACQ